MLVELAGSKESDWLLLIIIVFFFRSGRLTRCCRGKLLVITFAFWHIAGGLSIANLNAANSDLQVANSLWINLFIVWTRL